ncbi:hypothetical protein GQ44DRAFT_732894 [Phaeosphaeriaceae sp. PMI808]|nr:hypothetical protein GQ44DRAFT_732894 [Phaeosphaeriaceae sp. PMI808]
MAQNLEVQLRDEIAQLKGQVVRLKTRLLQYEGEQRSDSFLQQTIPHTDTVHTDSAANNLIIPPQPNLGQRSNTSLQQTCSHTDSTTDNPFIPLQLSLDQRSDTSLQQLHTDTVYTDSVANNPIIPPPPGLDQSSTLEVVLFNPKPSKNVERYTKPRNSNKEYANKGNKAFKEIEKNANSLCRHGSVHQSDSQSVDTIVPAPGAISKGPITSLCERGKVLAVAILSFIQNAGQAETKARGAIFYFLILILASSRLRLLSNDQAHELLEILDVKGTSYEWRQKILRAGAWLNDDVIVALYKKGWKPALAMTAFSLKCLRQIVAPSRPYLYAELRRKDKDLIIQILEDNKEFLEKNVSSLISGPDYIIQQVPELSASQDKICEVLQVPADIPNLSTSPLQLIPSGVDNFDNGLQNPTAKKRTSDGLSNSKLCQKIRRIQTNSRAEPSSALTTFPRRHQTELLEGNHIYADEDTTNPAQYHEGYIEPAQEQVVVFPQYFQGHEQSYSQLMQTINPAQAAIFPQYFHGYEQSYSQLMPTTNPAQYHEGYIELAQEQVPDVNFG